MVNGLYSRYRPVHRSPVWRFRYKFSGKPRAMVIGSYAELSLAKVREIAKELSARVALGYDVAQEKQERKANALAKIEAEKNALRVSQLASEYFERQILPGWKHPDILRRRIDKDTNFNQPIIYIHPIHEFGKESTTEIVPALDEKNFNDYVLVFPADSFG